MNTGLDTDSDICTMPNSILHKETIPCRLTSSAGFSGVTYYRWAAGLYSNTRAVIVRGTVEQQQRNRCDTRLVTYQGETKCLAEWAEEVGICRRTLYYRVSCGWSIERSLTEPVRKRRKATA